MPSNGLSARRNVLKRPLVCKSKKPGDCGACDLAITPPPQPIPPASVEEWQFRLNCDPLPTNILFTLAVFGAFTDVDPESPVAPNQDEHRNLQTPGTPGDYLVKMTLVNGNRCFYFKQVTVTVGP